VLVQRNLLVTVLFLAAGMPLAAQAPEPPPFVGLPPIPSGAPPPPALPAAPDASVPGFDGVNVAPPQAGGIPETANPAPAVSGSVDELSVLEGMILRITMLQHETLVAIDKVAGSRDPSERAAGLREISNLAGTIEGMLTTSASL
jgi:hypothetical protein